MLAIKNIIIMVVFMLFLTTSIRFRILKYFNMKSLTLFVDNKTACDGSNQTCNSNKTPLSHKCNLPFSTTSLQQSEQYYFFYKYFYKHAKIFHSRREVNEWHRNQTVDFNVTVDIKENENRFYFVIHIMDLNKLSNGANGGASFKLNFEGNHFLVSYSIQDYFNGTYRGCYLIPKECFTLTIRLLFLNYAAYFDFAPCPLVDVIYRNVTCPLRKGMKQSLEHQTFCKNYTSNTVKHGMWIMHKELLKYSERFLFVNSSDMRGIINVASKVNHIKKTCLQHLISPYSFQWFWKDTQQNCIIQQNDLKNRWKQCLSEYSSIYLVGDSHTRGIFSFITKLFGKSLVTQKNKWNDNHFSNVYFISGGYIDVITQSMHHLLSLHTGHERNLNRTVILFGFSSWDLQLRNYSHFFHEFHLFEKVISEMVQLSKVSNIKWIYMTRPSGWDNSTCVCDIFSKDQNIPNIYSVAAINEFTIGKLKALKLNFEVFDYFTLTAHRNNEIEDAVHYLHGNLDGTVGKSATDVLLTQLCPNQQSH